MNSGELINQMARALVSAEEEIAFDEKHGLVGRSLERRKVDRALKIIRAAIKAAHPPASTDEKE